MATGTVRPSTLPPPVPPPLGHVEHERVIQRQLGRTTWHVRLVDLASGLAMWVIGALAFLFVAALVDHWFGLGAFGRIGALAILAGGSLYYLLLYVVPLLVRSINPTYAARTIEEATPTLKNSLINFLLLKQDRQGLKEIVFQAVERQAASDIADVPVDTAVDRTRLIHAGYALCGVMAVFAAYKILSPKDPFQSVARVLAPWADIARPSRVRISDVQPGSAEAYLGQTQAISVIVSGNREEETVKLLYTTADGQAVDRPVEMALAAGGLRHECVLPPPELGSALPASGLQQNISYRIVAGDAESSTYRLTVISAPTIIVERLHYEFAAYTKKPAETTNQQGDIRALEGTKVTIHAVANQAIKSAWLEFDPAADESAGERMPLVVEETRARGTVTLQLKPDRQTPWHGSYQVRFYNERGQRSQQPILHKIDVIRDLAPEVQILEPKRLRVEVPEDGQERIEVRAVDPDFGLSRMRIEGTLNGRPAVEIDLLKTDAGQPPQAMVPYEFRPRDHKLKAGDELTYAAVAEDNRTSPQTGQAEPNATRTKPYTLVVLPPQDAQQGQGGDNKQPMPGGKPQPGENEPQPPGKQQPADQRQAQRQQPDRQQPRQPEGDKQQPGQAQNQEPQKNQPQKNQPQEGGPNQNQQQKQGGNQQQGNQQQGDQKQGDQKQESQQQQGGQQQGDQQQGQQQQGGQQGNQEQGQQKSGQQKGGQQDGQQQSGQGQQGGQQQGSQQQPGAQSDGQNANQQSGQQGSKSAGNQQQPAGQQGDPQAGAAGQQGGPGEGGKAHDGRAIEEMLKEMQKKGLRPEQGDGQAKGGQPGQQGAKQQPQEGPQPQQDAQPQGNQQGGQSEQSGQQPQSAGKSGGQAQNTPATGNPAGNDQKLDRAGQGKREKGQKGTDQKGNEQKAGESDRLPDDQQGQNPSSQESAGNKGGAPQGPSKTDKSEPAAKTGGEKRDPGAAQNGDEGAGAASQDKTGSGTAQEANRDHPKQQQPDSSTPEKSDPGAPSESKKQSDSKGGAEGDRSGGGKKGPGQSAKQKGNDSAGSQSAADQGAGEAQESGQGNTGDKAGNQQKADGKTGQAGNEAGQGSTSRKSKQGQEGGQDAGEQRAAQQGDSKSAGQDAKGQPGQQQPGQQQPGQQQPGQQPAGQQQQPDAQQPGAQQQPAGQQQPGAQQQPGGQQQPPKDASQSGEPGNQGQGRGGYQPAGGGDGTGPARSQSQEDLPDSADVANLEYARKATEMVLKKLKDEEHNPDPELLDKLGWTREDLAEFLRRWDALQKSAKENQDGQRELDEALKSLGLRDPNLKKRTGGQSRDNQRDLRDAGNRTAPPARYRDLFDAFRKGAARSRE